MRHINEKYPETTEIFQMGRTSQGRDIVGIRVTSEEHLAQETLPVIFVTAATSARDWITAMSAVNLIHMLAEYRYLYAEIVDDIDWYIIPVANPDGYTFSMTDGVSEVKFKFNFSSHNSQFRIVIG
jgi:murein tripeptide amidase MpaA